MISCEVIEDVLPLYCDRTACDETRKLVEEHLRACPACRKMLRRMLREKTRREDTGEVAVGDYGALAKRIRARRRRSAAAFGLVAACTVYFGFRLLTAGEAKERE